MKKIQLTLLLLLAGTIAISDPYEMGEGDPQKKSKKNPKAGTEIITTNKGGEGIKIKLEFTKGPGHNHPLMAIWVEDTIGKYIQTLYIAKSIATGILNYADPSSGNWTEGEIRRPAAVPYWSHKRGIQADDGLFLPTPENPVPDAYSGATPKNNFILETRLDEKGPGVFRIFFEINQPWDWNEYWTNAKYLEDYEYKTSSQPAVVYQATIDVNAATGEIPMEVIGHSHYSGKDGELYEDVSTLTTALQIADKIIISIE